MIRYAGMINFSDGRVHKFYTQHEDESNLKVPSAKYDSILVDEKGNKIFGFPDEQNLRDYALLLNSPWSQSSDVYNIKVNCKDGYTAINPDEPIWVCEYIVRGYERTVASICGYGDTPIEALQDCHNMFDDFQKKYNPDDESI